MKTIRNSALLFFSFLPWYSAFAENITYPDDSGTHLGTINFSPDSFAPSAASPSNNTVQVAVDAGNGITGDVYGGYEIIPDTGNPSELAGSHQNVVKILGGNTTIGGDVYGGYASAQTRTLGSNASAQSESHGNSVTVFSGEMSSVYGGYAGSALNVYGTGVTATTTSKSNNNSVTILDGQINGNVVGGYSSTNPYANSPASSTTENYNESNNNTINISGGTINGSVIGGDASAISTNANEAKVHITATNNTVNITGNPVFASWSTIYGGRSHIFNGNSILSNDTFTNNTLNFSAEPIRINEMGGFEYYNFIIPSSAVNNTSLITVSGTADMDNSYVEVKGVAAGSALAAGDSVHLIDAGTLTGTATTVNSKVTQGISLIYDVEVKQNGNQITATILGLTHNSNPATVNPGTKALSEGRAASLAFIGDNLIADHGIRSAKASIEQTEPGWSVFGIADGSTYRYDTGSHVDIDGFSTLAGAFFHQDSLMAGAFVEGGWGNYDTYNSFSNAASVYGHGNTNYYGAGVFGRYDFDNNVYVEGSLRAGRTDTDFKSNDLVSALGERASYDSKAAYYSAHVGAGYSWKLQEKDRLDLSMQYLWTHLKGDSVTVAGDPINFSSSDSHRARVNARLYHDVNSNFTVMGGLGYEYEFDGDIKAVTYRTYKIDTPSLGGGSGIGELGLRFNPTKDKNLTIDTSLRGYAGERKGVNGTVQINYAF